LPPAREHRREGGHAVRVTHRGISYYRHDNVHHRPVISNGTTVFVVARL
jgi:hypothetical protein